MDLARDALQTATGIPAAVWWNNEDGKEGDGVCSFLPFSDVLRFSLGSKQLLGLGLTICHISLAASAPRPVEHCSGLLQRLTGGRLRSIALNGRRTQQVNALVLIIAEHCTALTSLDVGGCRNLTDASIRAVAEHCTALTSLNVGYCHNLTDASITAIKQHRPALDILT